MNISLFTTTEQPNNSEAISAFIKSIRLRKTEEAITWLRYLWHQPGLKSRMQRRILVCSGEDNLSVGVINAVSDWYNSYQRTQLDSAAIEVARICASTNWWAQPDGHLYFFAWEQAEINSKPHLPKDYPQLLKYFSDAVVDFQEQEALIAFNKIYANRVFRPRDFAGLLLRIASNGTNPQAEKLIDIYARNTSALWLDGNISGQAVFALINGEFGHQGMPEVDEQDVMRMLDEAGKRIESGLQVPVWARDGIHTKRSGDRRFAGTVKQMAACCRAFEYYGRLSPDDEWLAQFYEYDQC